MKSDLCTYFLPGQAELNVEFTIPITACNFLVEYASFHENFQLMSLEKLICPRCSREVTDKHGICQRCRENANQCKQCRNINYENPDAYLCNECGYCKWAKFDYTFSVTKRYSFMYSSLTPLVLLPRKLSLTKIETKHLLLLIRKVNKLILDTLNYPILRNHSVR